jgi:CubicO group peptidase (beta-lactamase class C family)
MKNTNRLFRLLALIGAALQVFILCGCDRPAVESARPAPLPPLLADKDLGSVTDDLQGLIPSLMTKARIPGLQIALIRDGRIAWHRSFGVRNAETGQPVTDETIFEAASLTKPFFAYYAMKLVD